MSHYTVHVTRDGGWWMIHVPALDEYNAGRWPGQALTQARRFAEIEREAIDYICTVTDSAPGDVAISVV
ncbi:MAG: hypothetical protein QM774_02240 [Gordonia sp. (in: high G+C Gram-positive bacteria)]|uniref:hypothetical protein n=1 Tax=Gordonia sp. (in: high G+C Gram-positive bacteria) TaxID=84139 RepID=UPI0039E43A37